MIKYLFSIVFIVIVFDFQAQLKIIDPSHPGGDLNNTTITVSGTPSGGTLEFYCSVINMSNQDYSLKCRVTESNVLTGTENSICWVYCPPYSFAGDFPIHVVGPVGSEVPNAVSMGDTLIGFSAHYKPNNIDGCSLFMIEFFDETDPSTTLAKVYGRFTHNVATSCVSSLQENNDIEFSMYPNPANSQLTFKVDESNLSVQVSDLLGKTVVRSQTLFNNLTINLNELNNGVYFASVIKNGVLIKTEKLIVKH